MLLPDNWRLEAHPLGAGPIARCDQGVDVALSCSRDTVHVEINTAIGQLRLAIPTNVIEALQLVHTDPNYT